MNSALYGDRHILTMGYVYNCGVAEMQVLRGILLRKLKWKFLRRNSIDVQDDLLYTVKTILTMMTALMS